MMTGLHILEHGVRENGSFVLAESARTLAETLRDEGYVTGAFVSSFVLDKRFGLAQGFDHYDDEQTHAWDVKEWKTFKVDVFERPANLTTDRALDWLGKARQQGKPIFLWVHYFDPHAAWNAPAKWRERFRHPYDGEVAFMDDQIGRLLRALDGGKMTEHTLTVAVSDHGESLGEHGLWGHGMDIYEPAMRAVLMMRMPGLIPAGARVSQLTGLHQLAATMLGLLGLEGKMPGKSVRRALTGKENFDSPAFYMETLLPAMRDGSPEVRGVLDGKWKLISNGTVDELYNLAEDPLEKNNLSSVSPEQRTRARKSLLKASQVKTKSSVSTSVTVDDETEKKLRALGYISD